MGKGLLTVQPFYSDRFLLSKVSMAGTVILMNAFLDTKNLINMHHHWMILYLGLSAYPKWLFTLKENGEEEQTEVRVGNAVDVVG
jgi:26S proteasome regulatory subunit N1